jgi:uncharacterized membrane protein
MVNARLLSKITLLIVTGSVLFNVLIVNFSVLLSIFVAISKAPVSGVLAVELLLNRNKKMRKKRAKITA